ncbi:MAG: fibronectin type III domain-containing protein, partial [Candidatus Moraniibacteriota bacterium]
DPSWTVTIPSIALDPSTSYSLVSSATDAVGNVQTVLSQADFSTSAPLVDDTSVSTDTTVDLLSVSDITDTTASLRIRLSDDYRDTTLDFRILVTDKDTGKDFTIKKQEKTSRDSKVTLSLSDLLPDTNYAFHVKFSEKGKDDFSEYSNRKSIKTLASKLTEESTQTPFVYVPFSSLEWEDSRPQQDPSSSPKETSVKAKGEDDAQTEKDKKPETKKPETKKSAITSLHVALLKLADSPIASLAVSAVGAFVGVVSAVSAASIPFLSVLPTELVGRGIPLFGLAFGRRKTKEWGTVFDAVTKRPVPGVIVFLKGAEKENTISTCVTDSEGRYGFFVNAGLYKLSILKGKYVLKSDCESDPLYGTLYGGTDISVLADSAVIVQNIALDPGNFDWKSFAEKTIASSRSRFRRTLKYIFLPLFFLGFLYTIFVTTRIPSLTNVVFFIVYFGLSLYLLSRKRRQYGVVSRNKTPVPFAQVELRNEGNRIAFAVTDLLGRYFLLVPPGSYTATVEGETINRASFKRNEFMYLPHGVLAKDWEV